MIIVFDFDGVITKRGETLKEEAWEVMLQSTDPPSGLCGDAWVWALDAARREYGGGQGKGSRFDIIEKALRECGLADPNRKAALVAEYAAAYDAAVQQLIEADGVYPETRAALEHLSKGPNRLFVNTATPTEAAERSLKVLDLLQHFEMVYGRPGSKGENLEAIRAYTGAQMSSLLFIGDGKGDEDAATAVGCRFIGVANDYNGWSKKPYPLVHRLTELVEFLVA